MTTGVGRGDDRTVSAGDRLAALGYGAIYDAVVHGFAPYARLLDEIAALLARHTGPGPGARPLRVLDVACGTGTVVERLARDGHTVVGMEAVEGLVAVARRRCQRLPNAVILPGDLATGDLPGGQGFDALVSLHTLYWHPRPEAFLAGCRRALREGGCGVFLTYARRARVARTFAEVRAAEGLGAAARALRWVVPTAAFEALRSAEHRYVTEDRFHGWLGGAGFEILEARRTFLAGLSLLAWARAGSPATRGGG